VGQVHLGAAVDEVLHGGQVTGGQGRGVLPDAFEKRGVLDEGYL
jgi:hypothetical protein